MYLMLLLLILLLLVICLIFDPSLFDVCFLRILRQTSAFVVALVGGCTLTTRLIS